MRKHLKKLIFTLPGLFLIAVFATAQNAKISVKTFKKDTSFTCIASDDKGNIYAGSQSRGLVKYDGTLFKRYNFSLITRSFIRQLSIKDNKLYVAHSGILTTSDNNSLGGVGVIDLSRINGMGNAKFWRGQPNIGPLSGLSPKTRNTMAVFADTSALGAVWAASDFSDSLAYPPEHDFNSRLWYKSGGVAKMGPGETNFNSDATLFPNPHGVLPGSGIRWQTNTSIEKRQGSQAITAIGDEVWVSCRGYQAQGPVDFTAGILRFNRNTGAYIGKYDENNTSIPFGLTNTTEAPRAMYTDIFGRVWVALSGGRLAVMDQNGWHLVSKPTVLPAVVAIQPRAITGDALGRIYIGTDGGLLVYTLVGANPYADSLFSLYTTTDGLPTNFIRGTHVAKNGILWLATGNGVCRISFDSLQIYNMKPTQTGVYNTSDENEWNLLTTLDPTNPQPIRVAADGTNATIFKWVGKNPENLKYKIKESDNNITEFGELMVISRNTESLVIQYRHPKVLTDPYIAAGRHEITLQLIDETVMPAKIVKELKFDIVKPPVLLLHGFNSSGNAWAPVRQYLRMNANYRGFMIAVPDYPALRSYANNSLVALGETKNLLNTCANNSMSAGKVDVIGHSMGGLVARLFLQSSEYNHTYHKLITLNSPHSGTQVVDFASKNPVIFSLAALVGGGSSPAFVDLGVNSQGTNNVNGANLNKNIVPTHAIVSDYNILDNPYVNVITAASNAALVPGLPIPPVVSGPLKIINFIMSILFFNTHCSTINNSVSSCFKDKIYKDDHDLVVPIGSQTGGLPASATKKFNEVFHNTTIEISPVFQHLKTLLNAPTSQFFTSNGFAPPKLTYNGILFRPLTEIADTVQLISPASGTVYSAGQTIAVQVTGSSKIQRLLLVTGNQSMFPEFAASALQNHTFNYKIPKVAIGRVYLAAIGTNSLDRLTADSAFIEVTAPVGVTLDSLRISNNNYLKVYKGDSIPLAITGYYTDTLRNISDLPGISFAIEDVNVKASTFAPNYIIGVNVGFDKFVTTYQGKTDTCYIEVLEEIAKLANPGGVLPVKLSSFNGKLVNNSVQLQWVTAQEFNNSYFDIERSFDGINFEKIGQVNSKGSGNFISNYNFTDRGYANGINYYRLKQVDKDGKYTYSLLVLIRAKKNNQPQIIIYPNPATRNIVVNVAEGLHKEWVFNMYSAVGQLVYSQKIPANQNNENINLPAISSGNYTINIITGTGEKIYKGKLQIQK